MEDDNFSIKDTSQDDQSDVDSFTEVKEEGKKRKIAQDIEKKATEARKYPKKSDELDKTDIKLLEDSSKSKQEEDHLELFGKSIVATMRNLPPRVVVDLKMKINQLVYQAEITEINRLHPDAENTSNVATPSYTGML